MIDTVIFDFDGTLVNTNDVIIDAWQHTYRHYINKEMPVDHITKCFGEPLLITMAREFPQVPPEESAEVYRSRQREMADDLVRLFPGITKMLHAVKEAGYKMGVVTSRTTESTMFYMEKFGIADLFDALVSCDDTDKHKPDPEPLLLGLEKLGAEADKAIMIGDSPFDMKCANNAGVRTGLVSWRIAGTEETLAQCVINCIINEPEDLLKKIEAL